MAVPQVMTAAQINHLGPPQIIALERIDVPEPQELQVLVRVCAAGVGPWDALVRTGKSGLPLTPPLTLGSEISGIVEKVGANTTGFAPGDEVFGATNPLFIMGYAEYAVVFAHDGEEVGGAVAYRGRGDQWRCRPQMDQLRHDHEGLHGQVRHQDQRCEPGRVEPDQINAVNQLKGQSRAPDVLDMGTSFAVKADQQGILAPYRVASWSNIPASSKASDGTYYADYGGYVAIGYNSAKVTTPDVVRGPAQARRTRTRSRSTATRRRRAPPSPPSTRRRSPTAARSPTSSRASPTSRS